MKQSEEDRIAQKKIITKSTIIILIGLVVLTILSLIIISSAPTMKEQVEKNRPVERDTVVDLFILKEISSRSFEITTEPVSAGVKLGFNLSSNVPVHVALLSTTFGKNPEILYVDAHIPPGEKKKLEKAGNRFIYTTSEGEGRIKFCIVEGSSTSELVTKLSKARNVWLRLPPRQCKEIDVK